MEQESTWAEYKLPCPKCGGSDPVSKNKNGSAKCFSCGEFFPNYTEACTGNIIDLEDKIETKVTTFLNSYTGVYADLTDIAISEKTAKKYGVRVVYDTNGKISQDIYPYFNGNEIVTTKTRFVKDKNFRFDGKYDNTGLFG